MYHQISYCDDDNYDLFNCENLLKDDSILTCSQCKTEEGFWQYKNNRKIWIPNCYCPQLESIVGTTNICSLNKKLLPLSTYGIDFCQDDKNLELLHKFLKKKNVEYFYGCNQYIPNCLDTDILAIYDKKIIKLPFLVWDRYHLDLIEKMNKDDKIMDCRKNPYLCYEKLFYHQSHPSLLDLPPKCFYQIPVKNGTSILTNKIKNTEVRGLSCMHCRLFNGLCITKNLIYLFSNSLVYMYDINFSPINIPGKEINIEFKGIPNKIHGVFYWEKFDSLIFLRDKYYYKYSLAKKVLLFKGNISDTWLGVPNSPEGVLVINNDLYFFKKGFYYQVELYNYINLYKNYYLVFNDKQFGQINNSDNVEILTRKFNGEIISIDTLLKYKNKFKFSKYSGWIYGSNFTYQIQPNKNNNKVFKCLRKECHKLGGVYLKIKKNKRIDPGKVCKFGKICELSSNLPKFIDYISFNYKNNKIWLGFEKDLYQFNPENYHLEKKNIISKIFPKIIIPKDIKTINLCEIKKEKINSYDVLKNVNHEMNQTLKTNNKINDNMVNNLNRQAVKEINKNDNITIIKNDYMTKQRYLQQQEEYSNKIDKINYYLKIIFFILLILVMFYLIKIKYIV